ncbi:MAG TPA: hypothetical protein VGI23_07885, partial [Steroidobacteraceae bacterium]
MSTRRSFITQSSLGFVGAVAVRSVLRTSASAAATAAAPSATTPGTGAPSVADGPVLRWVPKHNELAYTFGGVAPRHRIQ